MLYWLLASAICQNRSGYLLYETGVQTQSIRKRRMLYCISAIMPAMLIMGLRSSTVGSDTPQYLYRFINSYEMLTVASTASEMGFNLYNIFFHDVLNTSWQFYLFVTSILVSLGYVFYMKKYSLDIYYSAFIYLTIGLFTMNMSGIRQSLAISFCLIALAIWDSKESIRKRYRIVLFFILIIFATTIHNSALVFSITPFIVGRRFSKKQVFLMLLVATLAILYKNIVTSLLPSFEGTRYADFTYEDEYAINPLVVLFTIFVPLGCLIIHTTESDGKYSPVTSLMFTFAALCIFFTMLSINNNQLGRLAYYFNSYSMILIPTSLSRMDKQNRFLFKTIITFICFIYFYISTIGGTLKIDNYEFFWNTSIYPLLYSLY